MVGARIVMMWASPLVLPVCRKYLAAIIIMYFSFKKKLKIFIKKGLAQGANLFCFLGKWRGINLLIDEDIRKIEW